MAEEALFYGPYTKRLAEAAASGGHGVLDSGVTLNRVPAGQDRCENGIATSSIR